MMGQILLRELQSWYNAVNNIVNIAKGSASNNKKDFGYLEDQMTLDNYLKTSL